MVSHSDPLFWFVASHSPRMSLAAYIALRSVVLIIIMTAIALSVDAAQSPCLLPNFVLNGPTINEPINVPSVNREEISCWTVGYTSVSIAAFSWKHCPHIYVPSL